VGMTGERGMWGHKSEEREEIFRALDVMRRKNRLVREAIWSCKLE